MGAEPAELLSSICEGDKIAAAALTPIVYDELRRLAGHYLRRDGAPNPAHTLQPTALVHEAYLRLIGNSRDGYKSRTHFMAVAAVAMRHVLIDHARGRKRLKRGGDRQRLTLSDTVLSDDQEIVDAVALVDALETLRELDERGARVVELRFFGGLTEPECAALLGVSDRTVRNDWYSARAWLRQRLAESHDESTGEVS